MTPPQAPPLTPDRRGAFVIEKKGELGEFEFNIKPDPGRTESIPDDQRELSHGIYAVVGVLKRLKELEKGKKANFYQEFEKRILEVAEVGLELETVHPRLANRALEQIRNEIVLRKGRDIKLRYLVKLMMWAFCGCLIGAAVAGLATQVPGMSGYGWVLIGAMVGAWMSVAAKRQEIAFEDMPHFLEAKSEPIVRLIFVGLLSVMLALFLDTKFMALNFGDIVFADFRCQVPTALLVGLVAGMTERTLSPRLIKRLQEVTAP